MDYMATHTTLTWTQIYWQIPYFKLLFILEIAIIRHVYSGESKKKLFAVNNDRFEKFCNQSCMNERIASLLFLIWAIVEKFGQNRFVSENAFV